MIPRIEVILTSKLVTYLHDIRLDLRFLLQQDSNSDVDSFSELEFSCPTTDFFAPK